MSWASVGGSKLSRADRCKELKLERHRPLSLMMGWRRSSERRDNATQLILLPTGDPVPDRLRHNTQYGTASLPDVCAKAQQPLDQEQNIGLAGTLSLAASRRSNSAPTPQG